MSDQEPKTVMIKPTDARPYRYAIWCTVGSGKPFPNTIVGGNWSEDGKTLGLWLDTHNYLQVDPDKEIEVVPDNYTMTDEYLKDLDAKWDRMIASRPHTKVVGLGTTSCV